ncbi:MAG: hypothetical protein H7Z72_06700 [Bacteroidetes bacterium]|nr:hypothetical protein [Fibrella sp.]
MIVLFIKSDLIRHRPLPGHPCPQCAKTDGMAMELRQRYAEFATITVNPTGVFGLVNCLHCGYTLPASRWTDALHRTYKTLKAGYKTPLSYWKGAIGTAIGIVVGTVLIFGSLTLLGSQQQNDWKQREAIFAAALTRPISGVTLAAVEPGKPGYTIIRVSRVDGETVWLRKYIGDQTLTNFYTETGWSTRPASDFSTEAVGYSATAFAQKGLKRIEDLANQHKPYEAILIAVLDK